MNMSDLPVILVIDDELRSLESIRRLLEEEFEVLIATSAEEAGEILEKEWVQVILCDQRMPGMTGVEFLKCVREKWPDIVRIIISGYTESKDIIAGINEAGIYQYIAKPWQPDALLLSVRAAAQMYRLQLENQQLSLELRTTVPVMRQRLDQGRKALRQRFPEIKGPKKDDICYATQNRQDAVRQLASECDLVLVVGSPNSSNSNRLRELAERMGAEAHLLDGAEDIDPAWVQGKQRIGVTAGASAPEVLVQEVINGLRALGADAPIEVAGQPENVTFSLPKELRIEVTNL